jgi:uncharacterized protein (DUF1684 family)
MLDLLNYRRTVFAMYATVRDLGTDHPDAYETWIHTRNELFGNHSQSALSTAQRESFRGLRYWNYNSDYRIVATLDTDVEHQEYEISAGDDGTVTIEQIGQVHFSVPTGDGHLGVYWITGYGGGIFIPFRDATNGTQTYGGGRYLYDTIKGADLGTEGNQIVLDFNYAYHPSCYYNERWVCPLAPLQNQLDFAIEAGEQVMS